MEWPILCTNVHVRRGTMLYSNRQYLTVAADKGFKVPETKNVLEMDLTPDSARSILKEIVDADDGRVFFVSHAEDQMTKRRITRPQVLRCLKAGRIVEGPYRDPHTGDWKVNMEVISAGNVVGVVAALDFDENIQKNISIVVTAFYRR